MIRVAVEGASGYVGGELLDLLLHHPDVSVVAATAGVAAGKDLGEIRPRLRRRDIKLASEIPPEELDGIDLLFLSLPHGESSRRVPELPSRLPVIDLAADFRIADREKAEAAYGAHPAWEHQKDFVYGLPELNRSRIREARCVAVPGCFATAAELALLPALEAGAALSAPLVSAVTGSSGSGHRPKPRTHHPDRALNFFAYEPLGHRHQPEIETALGRVNPRELSITLQTHSAPLVRGIYATAFFACDPGVQLLELYQERYRHEPLVTVGAEPPELIDVTGTPFASIGVTARGGQAVVFCAIDNLLKGAASQAVQCMNLVFGFAEDAGLRWPVGALP
jgi:N-acetyl-gamma-glutamyl-phosphate reductase common form